MAKGNITISRVNTGDGQYMEIRITDDSSSVEFVTATLSLENFAKAITGLGYTDCDIETRRLDLVGKKREHKTEMVACNGWELDRKDEYAIDKALAQYEVDGWIGSRYDMGNSKNYVGREFIKVGFTRYVDAGQEGDWDGRIR